MRNGRGRDKSQSTSHNTTEWNETRETWWQGISVFSSYSKNWFPFGLSLALFLVSIRVNGCVPSCQWFRRVLCLWACPRAYLCCFGLSHHYDFVFAEEEERELVDHGLDCVLQMRPHHFESAHIGEFEGQQRRPPADGQVLRVHAVCLAVLSHPTHEKRQSFSRAFCLPFTG